MTGPDVPGGGRQRRTDTQATALYDAFFTLRRCTGLELVRALDALAAGARRRPASASRAAAERFPGLPGHGRLSEGPGPDAGTMEVGPARREEVELPAESQEARG